MESHLEPLSVILGEEEQEESSLCFLLEKSFYCVFLNDLALMERREFVEMNRGRFVA